MSDAPSEPPRPQHATRTADDWMVQAQRDLRAAEHLLQGGFAVHATVCAHLAAEKALKALGRARTDALPPVSHDLHVLARHAHFDASGDTSAALDALSSVSILSLYAPDRPFGHAVEDALLPARERVTHAHILLNAVVARLSSVEMTKRPPRDA